MNNKERLYKYLHQEHKMSIADIECLFEDEIEAYERSPLFKLFIFKYELKKSFWNMVDNILDYILK